MPTLGVDFKISLATDKTRASLDAFYRGFKTSGINIQPYSYLASGEERTYDVSNCTFILFMSDVFDGANPFEIELTDKVYDPSTELPDSSISQNQGNNTGESTSGTATPSEDGTVVDTEIGKDKDEDGEVTPYADDENTDQENGDIVVGVDGDTTEDADADNSPVDVPSTEQETTPVPVQKVEHKMVFKEVGLVFLNVSNMAKLTVRAVHETEGEVGYKIYMG